MKQFLLSYREATPDQTLPDTWRDITLNTGGTQSTLQDIKVSERANGFSYKDATKHFTRNRFIYWHTSNDILELVEQSLDINLSNNRLKYRFVDTPILDGISIHETYNNVIILVPTVCSVHRLIFPHPNRLHKPDEFVGTHPDLSVPSIFAEALTSDARDPTKFYVFVNPTSSNSQLPHTACSNLTLEEEAIFVLAYSSGDILLVSQASDGYSTTVELKNDSLMPRFLSGIAEKFRSKNNDGDVVVSMFLHRVALETYIIVLTRDAHLRVWSSSKVQCIAVIDLLMETGDNHRNLVPGAQNHVLRKTLDENPEEFYLAVYLNYSSESRFHVFKPSFKGLQFGISRVNSLPAPDTDLVDFALTSSRIWSVWRGEDGDTKVYSAALSTEDARGSHWVPVILEAVPDVNHILADTLEKDPRQIYLQYIFHPGRFPLHVIQKSLSIYKRSSILNEVNLSVSVLRQRVIMAVENEIHAELKASEVTDEEYLECAEWCWQRFYSCCVQYYVADLKPLGLLLLPSVSGAILLKKCTYSILRPLEVLEHLMLCSEYSSKELFLKQSILSDDPSVVDDVIWLTQILVYLEQQMSTDFTSTFEKELLQLHPPDVVMNEMLVKINTEMDSEFTSEVWPMLENCDDLYGAMHKLLEMLRVDYMGVLDETVVGGRADFEALAGNLFSSHLGTSFAVQCLQQQAAIRYLICRNLLLLQNIVLEKTDTEWKGMEAIRSVCTLETVVLTQASFVSMWLTSLPALSNPLLETTVNRLAPLKLAPVYNLRKTNLQTISLMELFASSTGGSVAHKMLHSEYSRQGEEQFPHWHQSLLSYTLQLSQLIWPVSNNSTLSEWLLSSGQHLWLQQHVRLLNTWCEWKSCSRNFLLAVSFLAEGEFYKAEELFLTAAKGIYSDKFLSSKLQLLEADAEDSNRTLVNYYLKVIQLLELHNFPDCAINVANTALSIADDEDPYRATLYSIKFKHHLALKHYEMAFDALKSNPDDERKNDNLRDLVKSLLDDRQLSVLLSFNYDTMEEQFKEILFTRARATDAIRNVYYDFLYAYQMKRGSGFMRLAASIMYEQAFRLSQHTTMEALEKQVKCYLATKNALELCEYKWAWVVRPVDPDMTDEEVSLPPEAGSNEDPKVYKIKRQVEIVDRETVNKELKFAYAKLQLARFEPRVLTSQLNEPTELVTLLSITGLFKLALSTCTTFELSYAPVFEMFTRRCVTLMYGEQLSDWDWLLENDLHELNASKRTPAEAAWNMLEDTLYEYEQPKLTELHKAVVQKLIGMKWIIPHWLFASYKKRNPSELLRLLCHGGRLDEAYALASDYILAALGHGKEHFGFTSAMVPTGQAFCLPVYQIQGLISEMRRQNEIDPEKPLDKEYNNLKELFDSYLETAARISNEMCRYKVSQMEALSA